MPAQHGLQSCLSTSPTSGVKQDVNPTRNGLQEGPNLRDCGIRSITLVGGGGNENFRFTSISRGVNSKPLQFSFELTRWPEHRGNLQDNKLQRVGDPFDDRNASFSADYVLTPSPFVGFLLDAASGSSFLGAMSG